LKLLKLRPALPPWSIVALWRKEAETKSVKAFVAAALAKPTNNPIWRIMDPILEKLIARQSLGR